MKFNDFLTAVTTPPARGSFAQRLERARDLTDLADSDLLALLATMLPANGAARIVAVLRERAQLRENAPGARSGVTFFAEKDAERDAETLLFP